MELGFFLLNFKLLATMGLQSLKTSLFFQIITKSNGFQMTARESEIPGDFVEKKKYRFSVPQSQRFKFRNLMGALEICIKNKTKQSPQMIVICSQVWETARVPLPLAS